MSGVTPWRGEVPSLEEAARFWPELADVVSGARETTTEPRVQHVGCWAGYHAHGVRATHWSIEAVVVTYGYWSQYLGREHLRAVTLFQLVEGEEDWARFEVYQVDRVCDEAQAKQIADLINAGLPVKVAGGEL